MNIPLLLRLRRASGDFVAERELDARWPEWRSDVDALVAFGFVIESRSSTGAAYRGPAQRLCPDQIEHELGTRRIGRRIEVWDRVSSTNDLAARASMARNHEGLVILAEEQTAGRGRRGRSWTSPRSSSLLVSVVLFPPKPIDDPLFLTAMAAVAVCEVVESELSRVVRIKWPNDVRIEGRKVAGILVERGRGTVVGIGVNVNISEEELPDDLRASATSLQMETGKYFDRSELARALIRRFDELYDQALSSGAAPLSITWKARLEALGREVLLETPSGLVAGRLVDANLIGGLTIAPPADRASARRIPSPEVLALAVVEETEGVI